jgi:hypothetical protein
MIPDSRKASVIGAVVLVRMNILLQLSDRIDKDYPERRQTLRLHPYG